MKKLLILLVSMPISVFCVAQDTITELQRIMRARIIEPGIEVEIPVNNQATISMLSGFSVGFSRRGGIFYDEPVVSFLLAPGIVLSYKYFYNFQSRVERNRRIAGNSGNYFGVSFRTGFPHIIRTGNFAPVDYFSFNIIPTWGMQRALGIFHLSLALGPGIYFNTKGDFGYSILVARFGIGIDVTRW